MNYNGKGVISHVFSKVSREIGVPKASDELVLEKLWEERVHAHDVGARLAVATLQAGGKILS